MSSAKPLGYFHDIQNCPFPPNKSPAECVEALRNKFGHLGSEKEFVVVCDVRREKAEMIEALNYIPGVTVPHISSSRKESADKLLEMYLTNFAAAHKNEPGIIVLITSDEGFRDKISWLRRALHYMVILLHGNNVTQQFLLYPNEHHNFLDVLNNVPDGKVQAKSKFVKVYVLLLPSTSPQKFSKYECERRLGQIFQCRSVMYNPDDMLASLLFNDINEALKARVKEKEDVYGHSLKLSYLECKNWRENGDCPHGSNCRYPHFPESKNAGVQLPVEELVKKYMPFEENEAPDSSATKKHQKECEYYRKWGCRNASDDCAFLHVAENKGSDIPVCKFDGRCTNVACKFKHSAAHANPLIQRQMRGSYQPRFPNFNGYTVTSRFFRPTERSPSAESNSHEDNIKLRSLYVGKLKVGAIQADLDFMGINELAEYGWYRTVMNQNADGSASAFFKFKTPEGSTKAKAKLIHLKLKELSKDSQAIFTKYTVIDHPK